MENKEKTRSGRGCVAGAHAVAGRRWTGRSGREGQTRKVRAERSGRGRVAGARSLVTETLVSIRTSIDYTL